MLVLCGNKIDLQEERKVSTLQGEEVAKKEGMVFCETSAKSGDGVSYMVYSCVARLALVEQVNDGGIEKVVEELEEGNKNKEQSLIYDVAKGKDNELNVKGSNNNNKSMCNDGSDGKEKKKDINDTNNATNRSSSSNSKKRKRKCC